MDKTKLITFTTDTQQYASNIVIPSNCNSILFKNIGATNCQVDNYPLPPGEVLGIDGNLGEINVRKYNVTFDPTTGGVGNIVVTKKMYV